MLKGGDKQRGGTDREAGETGRETDRERGQEGKDRNGVETGYKQGGGTDREEGGTDTGEVGALVAIRGAVFIGGRSLSVGARCSWVGGRLVATTFINSLGLSLGDEFYNSGIFLKGLSLDLPRVFHCHFSNVCQGISL
jgi:hypothetical protein